VSASRPLSPCPIQRFSRRQQENSINGLHNWKNIGLNRQDLSITECYFDEMFAEHDLTKNIACRREGHPRIRGSVRRFSPLSAILSGYAAPLRLGVAQTSGSNTRSYGKKGGGEVAAKGNRPLRFFALLR